MSFLDLLGAQNNFQALGPNGQPINSVGQSGFQAQAMGGMGAANPMLGNAQANYGQQGDYINMLQGQAMGQGPSVAQELLRQQTQQNNQSAASAIASQRGMNPGLAQKLVLDQQANQNQQAAGQGSLLRAQEMMSARGMLGSALGQQAQSNLGAGGMALGQQGQQLGNYWNAQNLNSQTAMGNAQLQNQGLGINAGVAEQNAGTSGKLIGGVLGGLGGVGAALALSHGGDVPGDSPKNDKVPALLSPHEIVLPRSITLAEDAPERARDFVRAIKGRTPEHREGPWKMDKGGEVPALPAQSKGEQVKVNPGQPKEDPQAFRRVLMGVQSPGQMPAKMADGGDVPDPATDPGSFGPSSTTASFFDGQTSMTNPQHADPVASSTTQPPDMLAAPPPDALQGSTDPLAPSVPWGNSGNGGLAGRGPSLDYTAPKTGAIRDEMTSGSRQQAAGYLGEADAAKGLAKNQTQIMDSWNGAQADLRSRYQEALTDHQTKSDALFNDLMNSKVDPNNFWAHRQTGQKIAASIGMVLGGIGAGLTGGPNYAVDTINKAIDRDLEAQKLNIGKKENLLSHYMQQGRDMAQAHMLASADMKDAAAAQLARASAAYQGTNAANVAQIQIGALRQSSAMLREQQISLDFGNQEKALNMTYMRHAIEAKSSLTTGGGERVNPEFLDKDTRERIVDTPAGEQKLAPSTDDAKEFKKVAEAKDEFQATLNRMRAFRQLHSGGTWLGAGASSATATGKALHAEAVTHMNKIADLARFTPEERMQFEDQIGRPDAFLVSDSSFNAQLDELQRMLDSRLSAAQRNRLEGARQAMPPITRSAGQ